MADGNTQSDSFQTIEFKDVQDSGAGADPNAAVLKALDEKKFSWLHVKTILISGMGFFTDAYDLFIINLIVPMIGIVYFNGKVPVLDETIMKGAAVVGTFIGQVVFGIIADRYGRKKIYGVELILMIIGSVGSALACNTVRGIGVTTMLSVWRLILGIGIGGDYPLSAVLTSEYASVKRRGQMIAAVFAMQGIGILFGAALSLFLVACFKNPLLEDPLYADYIWRLCAGLGAVPAAGALYYRLKLPESPRFTMQVRGDTEKAVADIKKVLNRENVTQTPTTEVEAPVQPQKGTWNDFRAHFSKWSNLRLLLGCCSTWFLLDVAFYGLGLNQSIVLSAIGFVPSNSNAYDTLFMLASGNAIISLMGTVPGYWATVFLIEKMGRLPIQYLGFSVLTAVFLVLSAGYSQIRQYALWLFIMLYCIGLFMFNFGPNTTTFIIPGELFPTRFRSTGHGISAASGKLGAILATYAFTPIAKGRPDGVRLVLGIFTAFMFAGLLCTMLLKETKGRSLEQLTEGEIIPEDENTSWLRRLFRFGSSKKYFFSNA